MDMIVDQPWRDQASVHIDDGGLAGAQRIGIHDPIPQDPDILLSRSFGQRIIGMTIF